MPEIRDVFLVGGARTPIGRYGGALSSVRPDDMLALTLREALSSSGLYGRDVDEVVAGCANQAGEDNRNVARLALLLAGLPAEVPGSTVNRLCASGLSAVSQAYRQIAVGEAEAVVAGGVESMSRSPYVLAKSERPFQRGEPQIHDSALGWRFVNPSLSPRYEATRLGVTAEKIARRYRISRACQDEFAYRSHAFSLTAWARGDYDSTVMAVTTKETIVSRDECPRLHTSRELLSDLRPAFCSDGSVTAGNSSPLSDGAAAVVLASEKACKQHSLTPIARVAGTNQVGVHPDYMGIGPVLSTQRALDRVGWKSQDLVAVELNEAFAAQCLAVVNQLRLPLDVVNTWGGAIALGHPLGMSGIRLVLTLMARLKEQPGRGAATACVGVGQGETVLLESA
jgi:acetyl-CoA acetyltransferase family protein